MNSIATEVKNDPPVVNRELPYWYEDVQQDWWNIAIIWGPRWGLKTATISLHVLLWLMRPHDDEFEGRDCFVARQHKKAVRDSFYKELKITARAIGVDHLFEWVDSDQICRCLISTRELHSDGLFSTKDTGGLRGLASYGLLIGEEAQEFTQASIIHIENTIFRNRNTRAIYLCNRVDSSAIWRYKTKKEQAQDPQVLIIKAHWKDLAVFDAPHYVYIHKFKRDNPELYPHEFEGEALINTEAQVFKDNEWRHEDLDAYVMSAQVRPDIGCDPGWTTSLAIGSCSYYLPDLNDGTLYIADISVGKDMKASDYPALLAGHDEQYPHNPRWHNRHGFEGLFPSSDIHDHIIWCDTDIAAIRDLEQLRHSEGFIVRKAKDVMSQGGRARSAYWMKGLPGGIAIHPTRCQGMSDELIALEWAPLVGRPGEYDKTRILKKGNDHRYDAVRYSQVLRVAGEVDDASDVADMDYIETQIGGAF